ncbi:MAG: hypothetical protein ACPGF7_12970 [Pontibacterium sp.]
MIIANSHVTLGSTHNKQQSHSEQESLTVHQVAADGSLAAAKTDTSDSTQLSDKALALARRMGNAQVRHNQTVRVEQNSRLNTDTQRFPLSERGSNGPVLESSAPQPLPASFQSAAPVQQTDIATSTDPQIRLAAAIVSSITGKSIELTDGTTLQDGLSDRAQSLTESNRIGARAFSFNLAQFDEEPPAGTGMRYEHIAHYSESEQTAFSAQGEIRTADGQTINIELMMEMSHHYSSTQATTITAGAQLKDPLVINFAAASTELTSDKFSFDIDADGQLDTISATTAGSGMLMLDKNNDGKANDGTELFGALSGNGFADLSRYDDDQNNFIDEADAIYSELKIWVKSTDNNDQYFSLADKAIGAIYLGAVQTPFELKGDDNALLGQVKSSSFFVGQNGNTGTVQQIDLVV